MISILLPAVLRQSKGHEQRCELSDGLLAKLAGWEAVKSARGLVAADRVLSSDWQPPMLRGVVQEGSKPVTAPGW